MATHVIPNFGYSVNEGAGLIIALFPGVPIFFAISGYLIAESYHRSERLQSFALKRFKRIFPPMWGALAITALSIAILHPIDLRTFLLWLGAQATIGQNWHPDSLRSYGVGVVNGPLWSVCVEIALYIAIPVFAILRTKWLIAISVMSFAALYIGHANLTGLAFKIAYVTPLMWTGMFLTGTLLYRWQIKPSLVIWFPAFLLVLIASFAFPQAPNFLLRATSNSLGILNFVALTGLVFAIAFSRPIKIKADISYGVYLYHMPVLNAVMVSGVSGIFGLGLIITLTAALAMLSWLLIERHFTQPRENSFQVCKYQRSPPSNANAVSVPEA